jgi:hypothetical protein
MNMLKSTSVLLLKRFDATNSLVMAVNMILATHWTVWQSVAAYFTHEMTARESKHIAIERLQTDRAILIMKSSVC